MHTTRNVLARLITGFIVSMLTVGLAMGQGTKLAQAGMKFLSVGQFARQGALADAFTAGEAYAASMFYNPAGMARLGAFADISFGQTQWIADIKHLYAAVAISPFSGDYGVLGIQAQYVDYGTVEHTIRLNSEVGPGYIDLGTIKPYAYMVGVSYARALTNKFSIGGSVKWVRQDLGEGVIEVDTTFSPSKKIRNSLGVPAFDFGILYHTGFKSLTFGMTVRNFAREVSYIKENFQLPLAFKMGLTMNALDLAEIPPDRQSLLLAVDAEHPRDYPEQLKFGAEYSFMNTVDLRIGYVFPADEHGVCYGLGLHQQLMGARFSIDYAYTPFGVFTAVHRWSLAFAY